MICFFVFGEIIQW